MPTISPTHRTGDRPVTGDIGQVVYAVVKVSDYTYAVVRQETVAISSAAGAAQHARTANVTLAIEEDECSPS